MPDAGLAWLITAAPYDHARACMSCVRSSGGQSEGIQWPVSTQRPIKTPTWNRAVHDGMVALWHTFLDSSHTFVQSRSPQSNANDQAYHSVQGHANFLESQVKTCALLTKEQQPSLWLQPKSEQLTSN